MASNEHKCIICGSGLALLPSGVPLEYSCGKICDSCFLKDGTFCHKYHRDMDGWRKCDSCEWQIHCGCIMSEKTYDLTDDVLSCNDCLEKKKRKKKNPLA